MPTYYWKRAEKHKLLAELIPSVVGQLLLPLWSASLEALASGLGPETEDRLQVVRLCTVCVRDMLREAPKECPEAGAVIPLAFNALRSVANVAASLAGSSAEEAMSKTLQGIGKLIAVVHTRHPVTFLGANGELLPQYLDYAAASLENPPTPAVRGPCMAFLASVLRTPSYREATGPPIEGNHTLVRLRASRKEEETAIAIAAEGLVTAFFTESRITALLQYIVVKYFVLTKEDLSDWKEDPESFVLGTVAPRSTAAEGETDLEGERIEAARQRSFKEEAVAEELVLALFTGAAKESIGALTTLYSQAKAQGAILLQDACLHALGLGLLERLVIKASTHGAFLSEWFATVLGPELNQHSSPDQVVLHRRILWLVGQAAPVLRPDLKVAFCSLILLLVKAPGTDRVVRLTAAGTMATIMEATADAARSSGYKYDQEEDPFATADVDTMIATVLELFQDVESISVKQDILRAIPAMMKVHVMRMRDAYRRKLPVSPFPGVARTVEALPVLRQGVGKDMMLRAGVVDIAQQLMLVTGDPNINIQVAGPLIVETMRSLEASGDDGVTIRESTLSMWRSLMITGPPILVIAPLFQYALELIGPNTIFSKKELPQGIHIVTDFMTLGGADFVRQSGEAYVAALVRIMHNTADPDIYTRLAIMRACNILLPSVPAEAGSLLVGIYLAGIFKADGTGLSPFWALPSFKNEMSHHWCRLAYLQPQQILPIIHHISAQSPANCLEQTSFPKLLEDMITVMGRGMHCGLRLMACEALSQFLLQAPNEVALQPLVGHMLTVCVELMHKALEPAQLKRTLWLDPAFYPRDERERTLMLCGVDQEAEGIPLRVMTRLKELANIVGHEPFGGLVASLKPEIGTKLKDLGNHFAGQQSPLSSPIPGATHGWGPQMGGSTPPVSPLPGPALGLHSAPPGFTL